MGRPEARAGGRRQLQRGCGGERALLAAPTQGSKVGTATVPARSSRPPVLQCSPGCDEAGSSGCRAHLERWSLSP